MAKGDDAARYRANLQGEYDSAGLYRALAEAEPDPRLQEVYGRLAAMEEGHAEFGAASSIASASARSISAWAGGRGLWPGWRAASGRS